MIVQTAIDDATSPLVKTLDTNLPSIVVLSEFFQILVIAYDCSSLLL